MIEGFKYRVQGGWGWGLSLLVVQHCMAVWAGRRDRKWQPGFPEGSLKAPSWIPFLSSPYLHPVSQSINEATSLSPEISSSEGDGARLTKHMLNCHLFEQQLLCKTKWVWKESGTALTPPPMAPHNSFSFTPPSNDSLPSRQKDLLKQKPWNVAGPDSG